MGGSQRVRPAHFFVADMSTSALPEKKQRKTQDYKKSPRLKNMSSCLLV